jgi:hypothetical protein
MGGPHTHGQAAAVIVARIRTVADHRQPLRIRRFSRHPPAGHSLR